MDKLLKSGLINLAELAGMLWPDKPRTTASSLLHAKVHNRNGNSLSAPVRRRIRELLSEAFADFNLNDQK